MATQTYNFVDADNQLWCKCSEGATEYQTWRVQIAGLPAGATINAVRIGFGMNHLLGSPAAIGIQVNGNAVWRDGSPNAGTKQVDLTAVIKGNGVYDVTFYATAKSSAKSNVYFYSIAVVVEYTNPVSVFSLEPTRVDAGESITVQIARLDSSYTHRVTLVLGSRSAVLEGVATQAIYQIPLEWLDQLPSAETAPLTVTVETLSGSAVLGRATAQATVSCPAYVTPYVGQISTEAVDGKWGLYIQGYSRCRIAATNYAAGLGAAVADIRIEGNGDAVWSDSLTSSLLRTAGQVEFTVTVRDTRGRSAMETVIIDVAPYEPVAILARTAYRCGTDGSEDRENGLCAMLGCSYVMTALGQNNATVRVYWREEGAGVWQEIEGWMAESGMVQRALDGRIALDKAYEIRYVVMDAITTAEQTAVIMPGAAFMVWSKAHKCIGLGTFPTRDKSLSLAADWALVLEQQSMLISGMTALDFFWPVGAVKMMGEGANPEEIWGGSWEMLREDPSGVFWWVRVDDGYTAVLGKAVLGQMILGVS